MGKRGGRRVVFFLSVTIVLAGCGGQYFKERGDLHDLGFTNVMPENSSLAGGVIWVADAAGCTVQLDFAPNTADKVFGGTWRLLSPGDGTVVAEDRLPTPEWAASEIRQRDLGCER